MHRIRFITCVEKNCTLCTCSRGTFVRVIALSAPGRALAFGTISRAKLWCSQTQIKTSDSTGTAFSWQLLYFPDSQEIVERSGMVKGSKRRSQMMFSLLLFVTLTLHFSSKVLQNVCVSYPFCKNSENFARAVLVTALLDNILPRAKLSCRLSHPPQARHSTKSCKLVTALRPNGSNENAKRGGKKTHIICLSALKRGPCKST